MFTLGCTQSISFRTNLSELILDALPKFSLISCSEVGIISLSVVDMIFFIALHFWLSVCQESVWLWFFITNLSGRKLTLISLHWGWHRLVSSDSSKFEGCQ